MTENTKALSGSLKNLRLDPAHLELGAPIMHSVPHFMATGMFLSEMERVSAAALDDLTKLRVYYTPSVRNRLAENDWFPDCRHLEYVLHHASFNDQDCGALLRAVYDWAVRYHLVSDDSDSHLYINVAIAAISGTVDGGKRKGFPMCDELEGRPLSLKTSIGLVSKVLGQRPFELFEHPALIEWNPEIESWISFKARLQHVVDVHMDGYRRAIEDWYDRRDYITEGKATADVKHFTWLALYQTTGMSYADIAEMYDCDETSISKALTDCAPLVGVKLAPNKTRKRGPDRAPGRRPSRSAPS